MSNSALRNPNYLIYLIGNTISLHGLWIYRVALGWFAWKLSGSELWVGIIASTQFAPAVIFGPIFGVLADRMDRRVTSIVINAFSVINMITLGVLTLYGIVDIYVLAAMSLLQGVLDGAHVPIRMTIIPNLVMDKQLQSAIALTSVSFNLSRFIGPAFSGLIIANFGVADAFIVNGVSYLALIVAMIIVRLKPSVKTRERKNVWSELLDGAAYAFRHREIRALLLMVAMASIFARGALEMMPAFADGVYRGGAAALSVLTSAIGGGAIVAGLLLSRGVEWLTISVVRVAILLSGILIAVLGMIDSFPVSVGIVATLGVILSLCGVGSQILIQTLVDDEVRGRVSSFWGMIAFGGTALGSLIVGWAASRWGLQESVMITGLACAGAALLSGAMRKNRKAIV